MKFFLVLAVLLLQFSFIKYSIQSDHIEELSNYIQFFVRFFILFPIYERLSLYFTRYSLLPDDLEHFDAFGNFIGSAKDLLEHDENCEKTMNYTMTFKYFASCLYKGNGEDLPEDGWTDQEEIFKYPKRKKLFLFEFDKLHLDEVLEKRKNIPIFKRNELEESSEDWEMIRDSYFYRGDYNVDIKKMPKTFSSFEYIKVPLSSRLAVVLETYLIDLTKLFYPFLKESKLNNFDDLLALILFYLYLYADENNNNLDCCFEVINDLKKMGTILKLPQKFNRIECLKMLLDDVLMFDLYFTFNLFIYSKILNLSSPLLIEKVLKSENQRLIKLFLKEVDRNVRIINIKEEGGGYDGNLCHYVYWTKLTWLIEELAKYYDVDWNSADSRGYTVLGYMVNDPNSEGLYKLLLQSTSHYNICYKAEGFERNILDECLRIESFHLSMSRLMTFLDTRKQSDDFSDLLLSAAFNNRLDLFDLILLYRRFNCIHELNVAFQSLLLKYMEMGEVSLYKYLLRILVWGREWHGCKGNKLEHLFFMKWEIQLARWSTDDEIDLKCHIK